MEKKYRLNILKLYVLNFFMMFLVLIPVIVPYWQSFGLTLKDIYELQAIFGFVLIVLDVPAGYLSDLFGRKNCLIFVGIMNGIAYTTLAMGSTFGHFVLYEIFMALAISLFSGCDIAMIYDSLDAIETEKVSYKRENDLSTAAIGQLTTGQLTTGQLTTDPLTKERVQKIKRPNSSADSLGMKMFSNQLGETVASLLGGILAVISLQLSANVNAFTAWIPLLIILTLIEPPRKTFESSSHLENFKYIFSHLFLKSKLLRLLIIFNIVYGFSTYAAVWSYQTYWASVGIPMSAFGYLWAAFNLTVALIAKYSIALERKVGSTTVIVMVGLSPIFAYLGMGFSTTALGIFFLGFFAICRGFNGVVLQDGINSRVPPNMRATTHSFCSLGMRAIFFIFGPLFGSLLDTKGLSYSFQFMGFSYLVLFFLITLPLIAQKTHFRVLK